MRTHRTIFACLAVLTVVGGTIFATRRARAQDPGDTINFLFPQNTEVALPLGEDPGDKVVYTGHMSVTTDGGTCATGTFPIQSAAIVDPRNPGARTTRRAEIVTTSQTDSVKPGTRLTNLGKVQHCIAGGVDYDRYSGVVD